MTVADIIKEVRLCIDEEAVNATGLQFTTANAYDFGGGSVSDVGLMDSIIISKIGTAIRWICLYAPSELLSGSDEATPTGIIKDASLSDSHTTDNGVELQAGNGCKKLVMPTDFIKLLRVRVSGWHRAVKHPISEDSDAYTELYDESGATATNDRPVAAIIEKSQSVVEVWPCTGDSVLVEVSYISSTDAVIFNKPKTGGGTEQAVSLPPRAIPSFIYYLSYLLLSAYGDQRAERMFEIAKMNLGK